MMTLEMYHRLLDQICNLPVAKRKRDRMVVLLADLYREFNDPSERQSSSRTTLVHVHERPRT